MRDSDRWERIAVFEGVHSGADVDASQDAGVDVAELCKRFMTEIAVSPSPNYANVVNQLPELFTDPNEWAVLGTKSIPRHYPQFNALGNEVIGILYRSGKVRCEFPGISPTTLQNFCPAGMHTKGCLAEGILLASELEQAGLLDIHHTQGESHD